ncbi:4-demethylwyosine synthase TYW1 [Candidatus Woesearchaeota archaeon]|nr:4-demethylwyosine synthase TYW1 [Candidatus Woesearchaeota archaeon]
MQEKNKKGVTSKLLNKEHVSLLKKQQYYFSGNHSAVKICTWTKKSLRDEDVCYKEQFYGIRSHLCCQMSPAVSFCQNSCIFCWRDLAQTKGTSFDKVDLELIDSPEYIIKNSIFGQQKLLEGFAGSAKTNMKKFKQSTEPMHFAISLTGEATLYPHLPSLIKKLHKLGKTTFLVTNGMCPEMLERLEKEKALPTQLYISIDAPNEKLFKKIDRSAIKDGWEKLMQSLDILKRLKNKTRTCVRITAIKDLNMVEEENYAKLIEKSDATFVEVKSYMWVGGSRDRLLLENMPRHSETKEFALNIADFCDYKLVDEKQESRVVLLMKEDFDGRIMKF